MTPPEMRPWNLAIRLGLELAALTGLGLASWNQTTGAARPVASIAVPLAAAALWATFNVLDDPSRSGKAPVEVSGRVRLGVELLILGSGWTAYSLAGFPAMGGGFAALTVLHYLIARERVQWLLSTTPQSNACQQRESSWP